MGRSCKIVLALWIVFAASTGAAETNTVTLLPSDRVLVLAPHPDDEVIGCGGIIQEAVKMKLPVRVVFLTYGDSNPWANLLYRKHPVIMPGAWRAMGSVRHDEAIEANKKLGLDKDALVFLGYPDFGTLSMWHGRWDENPAYRGIFTRVRAVPYATALRPGASYKGDELLCDLESVLLGFHPTKVFVSHPADHNGDHRALYLFTRVALWDLEHQMKPHVYPYLIHFEGWPKPGGNHPSMGLRPPKDLEDDLEWQTFPLTADRIAQKQIALRAHVSQYKSSAKYLSSFVRTNELFGDFPDVVLSKDGPTEDTVAHMKPPHNIQLDGEDIVPPERSPFLGIEYQRIRLDGDAIELSIILTRAQADNVEASFYIFGYRPDKPFAKMPKLRVQVDEMSARCEDQSIRLPPGTVTVKESGHRLSVRIPLKALDNPTHFLVSGRVYVSNIPLSWSSWRIVELPSNPK